jgi:hypothetical protein
MSSLFPDLYPFKGALLALALLAAAPVSGQELKLTPSLAVKKEYNDNIFLAPGSRVDDFISTLTPALELSSRTERHDTSLSGGINWLKYARHSGSDAVDYFVNGAGSFQIDPRLALSAGASCTQNSRPDQIDPATGLTINSENRVQIYQAGGSYMATEKSRLSLSYGYSQQDYSRVNYLGSRQHQASAGLSYALTPQTSLEKVFTFNRQLTDISAVDNYSATLGLSYRLRELWSLSLNAGGRYTRSDLIVSKINNISNGDWGWVGGLSCNYSGEKLTGSASFNHDVSLAAGRTGSTQRTGGSVTLGNKFTKELSGAVDFGYYWNKSSQDQFSVLPIDEKTLELNCRLHYDFNNDLALEANYHHVNTDYGQLGTRAGQNIFLLRLVMRHEFFL